MATFQFPMALDAARGRFCAPDGRAAIRQSVYLILATRRGERPFRPDFGTFLTRFAFENLDTTAENLIRQEVVSALQAWEPRVHGVEVTFEPRRAQGVLLVHVAYTAGDSGARDGTTVPIGMD